MTAFRTNRKTACSCIPEGRKVGAKPEDVKKHYESMVPMRRGVYPSDIVRAILYAVEQEYETGQAIPVTGGQIMLH